MFCSPGVVKATIVGSFHFWIKTNRFVHIKHSVLIALYFFQPKENIFPQMSDCPLTIPLTSY